MKKPVLLVGLVAGAFLLGVVIYADDSGEAQPVVAAKVGQQEIRREVVERWSGFENEIRLQMGLRSRAVDEVEATALESLLRAEWIRREASSRGITMGPGERRAAVAEFEARIGLFGWAIEDARSAAHLGKHAFELRAVAIALEKKMAQEEPLPSSAPLRRYYRTHGWELGEPEQRSFDFLLASSEDEAVQGKRALANGEDWETAANRYSHPEVLRDFGWQKEDATRSGLARFLSPELADAAFAASTHTVLGPKPLEGGWIVFEVTEVKPSFLPSFQVARQALRNRLQRHRRDAALASLQRRLRAKYGDETLCAADFHIAWCRPLGVKP